MGLPNVKDAMRRSIKTMIGCLVAIVVIAIGHAASRNTIRSSAPSSHQPTVSSSTSSTSPVAVTSTNARIVRAVDGDTLVARIDGAQNDVRVRLLGVNTPESVDPRRPVQCFGKEASHFTASLVEGKRVNLIEDAEADDRDVYNRLLRNVELEDGTDVNQTLVREGYAYAYVSFPMNRARKNEMRRLEAEARRAGRGLWNPSTCDGKK